MPFVLVSGCSWCSFLCECTRAPACASVPHVSSVNSHQWRLGHAAHLSLDCKSNSKASKQAQLCLCASCLTTWGQKSYSNCPSITFELPLFDCRPQQMFSISEPEQLPLTTGDTLSIHYSSFCFCFFLGGWG